MADSSTELQRLEDAVRRRTEQDPWLAPFAGDLLRRLRKAVSLEEHLTGGDMSLADFASGHEFFGLHLRDGQWVLREWAPAATAVYLKGPFSGWQALPEYLFSPAEDGVWVLELDAGCLAHGVPYRLEIRYRDADGGEQSGDRLPAFVRRVVYNEATRSYNAEVWQPPAPYQWQHECPSEPKAPLLIYEAHIGMASEEPRIGSYSEFRELVLPRIKAAGYNAIQIMALAEHPYYASFGYQVSSFFACSSRFGTPDELKALVDAAHGLGLHVLMDLVHSHAVKNEVEGLSLQDGTSHLYFHQGGRGEHSAWDSRCFDYGKGQVLHFLLSNCRYWLDEFHFDGFRFDGVTSMLYTDHGLGRAFTSYDAYFGPGIDEDAISYLRLANKLVHELHPGAITIAEDVSGMPGLAAPLVEGGVGFDFRFAMGIPDQWVKLTKDRPDEEWSMSGLWYELTNRRHDERTISYAECHDQALVGDQTLIFRLLQERIYDGMSTSVRDLEVDRGIALHKMIRLLTLSTAGHGYLNFMGNEFGHPEWVDFPREGNNWSYHYARRQWSLAQRDDLRYRQLLAFDHKMLELADARMLPNGQGVFLLTADEENKVLAHWRADLVFVFNFHPTRSLTDHWVPAAPGRYRVVLDSDARDFGGFERQDTGIVHDSVADAIERHHLSLYLPARTCLVLERIEAGSVPSS
ncbi:MAG: 1,4-alpha-glucan-branching enzyme [Planctomycetota bacterium]|nr:MAG: 1,4-alpha-glucan-branching enzyme [Planctomycetota bacterium]